MDSIVYKIDLDCRRSESQAKIEAKCGEASGRKIIFSLYEGRSPYVVPSGVTAVFRAKKPSGAVLFNNCAITDDGNIEYVITTQTVAEVGIMPCELQLIQGGKVIFSPCFTMVVVNNLAIDSEVESSDEFTALVEALSNIPSADNFVQKSGATMTGALRMGAMASLRNRITMLADPTSDYDATNKKYVDDAVNGVKQLVVTLSADSNGNIVADKTFAQIHAAAPNVVATDGAFQYHIDLVMNVGIVFRSSTSVSATAAGYRSFTVFNDNTWVCDESNVEYALKEDLALKADKDEIPTALPNPHKLTINGTDYDGSADVAMTIQGGGGESYDDTELRQRIGAIEAKESTWDAKSNFSGNYNDLTNKPTIPEAVTDAHINSLIDNKIGNITTLINNI